MKTILNSKALPTICILLAAACWGMIGLWSLRLLNAGLSPYSIVVVRNCGGLVVLLALALIKDKNILRIDFKDLKYFFGTGVVSVLFFTLCYFSCQEIVSLSVAAILLYTAPAIVVVLSALLWKEPITKGKIVALVLTFFGACSVSGAFTGELVAPLLGIILGLGAGFFYALYSIVGHYALEKYLPMTVAVWTFIFCGVGSLFFIKPAELTAVFSQGSNCLLGLGLVVISTMTPYLLYNYGLSRIEAGRASIMASLEPVVACIVGVVVFGEGMTVLTFLGIASVLGGVYCITKG